MNWILLHLACHKRTLGTRLDSWSVGCRFVQNNAPINVKLLGGGGGRPGIGGGFELRSFVLFKCPTPGTLSLVKRVQIPHPPPPSRNTLRLSPNWRRTWKSSSMWSTTHENTSHKYVLNNCIKNLSQCNQSWHWWHNKTQKTARWAL